MFERCEPLGFLALAVPGNGAVGLTSQIISGTTHFVIPANADLVLLVCETGAVRFRDDNGAISASVGMIIQPTMPFEYTGSLSSIQFYGCTGTVAVNAAFYKASAEEEKTMTAAQVSWLNSNLAYTPLCRLHPSFCFTQLLTLNADGSTSTGDTVPLPPSGALSGGETRAVVCGVVVKVGP